MIDDGRLLVLLAAAGLVGLRTLRAGGSAERRAAAAFPKGASVVLKVAPGMRPFYAGALPDDGAAGKVAVVVIGQTETAFVDGPRGGLVFVDFSGKVTGVSPEDLTRAPERGSKGIVRGGRTESRFRVVKSFDTHDEDESGEVTWFVIDSTTDDAMDPWHATEQQAVEHARRLNAQQGSRAEVREGRRPSAPPSAPPSFVMEPVGRTTLWPGRRIQISALSGIDSEKWGTVVDRREIQTDGRGVPTNVPGAYRPVDWSKEVAVLLDDGTLRTMFKNRLMIRRSLGSFAEVRQGRQGRSGRPTPHLKALSLEDEQKIARLLHRRKTAWRSYELDEIDAQIERLQQGSRAEVRKGRSAVPIPQEDSRLTQAVWAANNLVSRRGGKPVVRPDDAASILDWLRWNDRDGDYEDGLAENLDDAQRTLIEAWPEDEVRWLIAEANRRRGSPAEVRKGRSRAAPSSAEGLMVKKAAVRVSKDRTGGYKVFLEIYSAWGAEFANIRFHAGDRRLALEEAERIAASCGGLSVWANSPRGGGYAEVHPADPGSGVGPWRLRQWRPGSIFGLEVFVLDAWWPVIPGPRGWSIPPDDLWSRLDDLVHPAGGRTLPMGGLAFTKDGRPITGPDELQQELPIAVG
jgi:hypothetical protein